MNSILNEIKKAAAGLLFISESEHPLELISFSSKGFVPDHLKTLADANNNAAGETQTLEYFFRNMTRTKVSGDNTTAEQFKNLQDVLQKNLKNINVYRLGSRQVTAFIIGELADGNYAGLKTLLIET